MASLGGICCNRECLVLDGTLAENIALGCRSIDKGTGSPEIVRLVKLDAWVDEIAAREWILLWVKGRRAFGEVKGGNNR